MECAREERALATLAHLLSRLPKLERNALEVRRTRQSLMSALNDAVIDAPKRAFQVTAMLGLASTLIILWWLASSRRAPRLPSVSEPQIIDVYAAPGARWSAHTDARLANVDFTEGAASFTVHPHEGRRVLVRLPDGEVEDTGTVFEVRVREQRTERIAVSEGKVLVRLRGRSAFSLAAGEAWEAAPSTSATAVKSAEATSAGSPSAAQSTARRAAASVAKSGTSAAAMDATDATNSSAAEDDAYLHIVTLLRAHHFARARDEARSYLLRFPNGFRRVEVLDIAAPRGAETPDASGTD